MSINLYTDKGWLDIDRIMGLGYTYIFNVGQRGCGKTYGYIKWLIENNKKWIYVRRTEKQINFQADPILSSLIPNVRDMGINWSIRSLAKGQVKQWWDVDNDKEICLCCALSTFNGMRGASFIDYDYILFDEFIKSPEEKPLKNEGDAIIQMYETINRNRELYDPDTNPNPKEPVKLICIGNAFDIANDAFLQFNIIDLAERLAKEDNKDEIDARDDKLIIYNKYSPKAKDKEDTSIYKNVDGSIIDLNLKNKFILNDFTYVGKIKRLIEYRCIWNVGLLYIYEHKNRQEWYVSRQKSNVKETYTDSYSDLERMKRKHFRFWIHYLDGYVKFDSYESVAIFEKYFDK